MNASKQHVSLGKICLDRTDCELLVSLLSCYKAPKL